MPSSARPRPRVTAIVVTFEGRHLVRDCLTSLSSAVSERHAMDVLVIDNNSSDGTPDLVSSHFPGLRLIRMESNLGYGAACNLAAAASTSEYIAVVNQDVVSI